MLNYLWAYLSLIPLLAALDLFWLGVLMRNFYVSRVGHLMADSPNWWAAVGFYALFPVGVLYFAAGAATVQTAAFAGGMLGLITYGTYNFTNMAVLKGWPATLGAFDILWGVVLGALLGAAGHMLLGFFSK
jgi:uncharacterized membrane protein